MPDSDDTELGENNDLLELLLNAPPISPSLEQNETMCKEMLQPYVELALSKRNNKTNALSEGRNAMGLAVANAFGIFFNQHNIHQTLFWLQRAAELDYAPAMMYGRRVFEAHKLPVPDCFPKEEIAASSEYSKMVRKAWRSHYEENCLRQTITRLGLDSNVESCYKLPGSLVEQVQDLADAGTDGWLIDGKFHLMHFYCMFGMLGELEELLERHPEHVNTPLQPSRETPLVLACKSGNAKIALLLLRTGKADPCIPDAHGQNPFHFLFTLPAEERSKVSRSLGLAASDSIKRLLLQSTESTSKVTNLEQLYLGLHGSIVELAASLLLQSTNKVTYIEPLFLGLHGSPVEWAALSGNLELVQFYEKTLDLSLFMRQRIVIAAVRLALPDLLEYGLKLALEAENPEALQRSKESPDGRLFSLHEMNLYGCIGVGAVVTTSAHDRKFKTGTANLCTSWIAHGSETGTRYSDCIDILLKYQIRTVGISEVQWLSAVQRALLSGNTLLLDILLSRGFPLSRKGEPSLATATKTFSNTTLADSVDMFFGILKRHEPEDILPIFEIFDKYKVLTPQQPDEYDLLKTVVSAERETRDNRSLLFLVHYLLEHGYREIHEKKQWGIMASASSSPEILKVLLDNGGKNYVNVRWRRRYSALSCQSDLVGNYRCDSCEHPHSCGTLLFKFDFVTYDFFEEFCKVVLEAEGETYIRGFHSRTIFHAIIDRRLSRDRGRDRSGGSTTRLDSLFRMPQFKAVVNQPDYLDATPLQYATVYGDEHMVKSLLDSEVGGNPSLSTSVPEPCVLVSHSLRFPPWFVIQGDTPPSQDPEPESCCKYPTMNIVAYREALMRIRGQLLEKRIMNKNCNCVLCSDLYDPRKTLSSVPNGKRNYDSVRTVFPRYFHRNDIFFIRTRDEVTAGNWYSKS